MTGEHKGNRIISKNKSMCQDLVLCPEGNEQISVFFSKEVILIIMEVAMTPQAHAIDC